MVIVIAFTVVGAVSMTIIGVKRCVDEDNDDTMQRQVWLGGKYNVSSDIIEWHQGDEQVTTTPADQWTWEDGRWWAREQFRNYAANKLWCIHAFSPSTNSARLKKINCESEKEFLCQRIKD